MSVKQYFHNLFNNNITYKYAEQLRDGLISQYGTHVDLLSIYHLMTEMGMIDDNGLPTAKAFRNGWID